jgi:hypothetical protein
MKSPGFAGAFLFERNETAYTTSGQVGVVDKVGKKGCRKQKKESYTPE